MGLRGPAPTPKEILELRGSRKAAAAPDSVRADGVPERPRGLAGEARKLWDKVVPDLVARGVAKSCDAPALVLLCDWHARYLRFAALADAEADPPKAAKLMRVAGQAWGHFDRIASRFGLTPGDRARLRADAPTADASGVMARRRVPARDRNAGDAGILPMESENG